MTQTELFTAQDLEQLAQHGISPAEAQRQIAQMRSGVSYLPLVAAASRAQGIFEIDPQERVKYLERWQQCLKNGEKRVVKFVPASGAASRMFKGLYAVQQDTPLTQEQARFFENLEQFAFWGLLNEACLRNNWRTATKLREQKDYTTLVQNLLEKEGLRYGTLPKALLAFHKYPDGFVRTPLEEHMVEGCEYVQDGHGKVRLHFTVSPEHLPEFRRKTETLIPLLQDRYGAVFEVEFSTQSPETDTLALDAEGNPFRTQEGTLLLRPGGHGALISNLSRLEADIVFIKNIDNVVPDSRKSNTILYKKLLGGILLAVQERIFAYLRALDGKPGKNLREEIAAFLSNVLGITLPQDEMRDEQTELELMRAKLNRPLRVCGMVRNEGEPGGGPFIVREPDGSTSLQILESVQINPADQEAVQMMQQGQFFNPVDLCCGITDYQGNRFPLEQFVNHQTAFLSHKSLNGRELTALERPGLWNGAMHFWNTLFVEVPADTFAPVKTVLDLLKESHQSIL